MSDSFDPYLKWLGIKPIDQPPSLYRLLGVDLIEDDPDIIENAADSVIAVEEVVIVDTSDPLTIPTWKSHG